MNKKIIAMILAGTLTCSMLLAGCGDKGLNTAATAATLGDKTVSLGYVNFCVKYSQSQADYIYSQFYSGDYWNNENYGTDDYATLGDMLIGTATEAIERQLLLEQHMADYSVEITDDEMAKIEEAAKSFMEANTDEAIKAMGATEDIVKEFLYYQLVDSKMSDVLKAEDTTVITDEDAKQRAISYLRISKTLYTDDAGQQQTATEEDVDRIREEFTEVAVHAAADWDTIYAAYDDVTTVSALSTTYGKDAEETYSSSDFYTTVLTEADKLEVGEVSGLIEADSAFYIVKLDNDYDEEATASKKEELQSEAGTTYVNNKVEEYKTDDGYTVDDAVLDQIVFDTIFNY